MRVTFASSPAPGRPENEDAVFQAGPLVGVLDGVTAPVGVATGCVHTPAWYVRRLVSHLSADAASLPDCLATAISLAREDHGGQCDLSNPATPAATVCLVRATDRGFDYLILSDTTLVVDRGDEVLALTDDRFARLDLPVVRADYFARKYERTNQPGGYWVANSVPEAAYQALTGSFPTGGADGVRRAALLTDGVSALVDLYRRMDWPTLLDTLTRSGPAALIEEVRRVEYAHTGPTTRWKRHDDATAALCTFTRAV
ncbi:hypothetical protein [Dactylosporangium sp. CS-033363]|uniref:hypothetical protein n=1 Tax=Dactylosporangium sp. CS-033363 TaxID=3239935 RepID=UPI003D8DAAE2